jgi:hypothetical protein
VSDDPLENTEPTTVEVPAELRAEIEKAFDGFADVPDHELVSVVEALHAFLDAWGGDQLHDRLMSSLHQLMLTTSPTSEEAPDRLRDWIKEATNEMLRRMRALGLETSAMLVYHPSTDDLRFWTIGPVSRGGAHTD